MNIQNVFLSNTLCWGFSTLGCPQMSLREALALADKYNIHFLELRAISGSVELHLTLMEPDNRDILAILAKDKRTKVFGSSFEISRNNPEARKKLLTLAGIADQFDIPYLRVFGGIPFSSKMNKTILNATLDNIRWFNAQNFNCQLALETHDGYSSADRCAILFDYLGQTLPVIWDTHHTWRDGLESFSYSLDILKDTLVDIHFKDSLKNAENKIISQAPGKGEVPLNELFLLLKSKQINCPVVLEHEKLWEPELPGLPEALDTLSEFLMHFEISQKSGIIK